MFGLRISRCGDVRAADYDARGNQMIDDSCRHLGTYFKHFLGECRYIVVVMILNDRWCLCQSNQLLCFGNYAANRPTGDQVSGDVLFDMRFCTVVQSFSMEAIRSAGDLQPCDCATVRLHQLAAGRFTRSRIAVPSKRVLSVKLLEDLSIRLRS